MTGMNYLTTLAYVKADMAKDRIRTSIAEFKEDESGVEGFVVALILIGIAVIAAIAFKDALVGEDGKSGIVGGLIKKIKDLLGIK